MEHGPAGAWHTVTREAIDAHLAGDEGVLRSWMEMQRELKKFAPRPGTEQLDIRRAAKILIEQHGAPDAWRFVMGRAMANSGNTGLTDLSLQIADTVMLLVSGDDGQQK